MKCNSKNIVAILFYLLIIVAGGIGMVYQASSQTDNMQLSVVEWSGKEFLFADTIKYKMNNQLKDSVNLSDYYIISYLDSTTCTTCRIRAFKKAMNELEEETGKHIRSLLIIDSRTLDDIPYALEQEKYDYPYLIDNEGYYSEINNIPRDDKIRTFLLDSSYHVVYIGNPIVSRNIFELFANEIKEG